eukprot:gene44796-37435_t
MSPLPPAGRPPPPPPVPHPHAPRRQGCPHASHTPAPLRA